MTITYPWKVIFDFLLKGGPEIVIMNELEDWTMSNHRKVKYYSGSALYRNSFTIRETYGSRYFKSKMTSCGWGRDF